VRCALRRAERQRFHRVIRDCRKSGGEHQEPWEMLKRRGRLPTGLLQQSPVLQPADDPPSSAQTIQPPTVLDALSAGHRCTRLLASATGPEGPTVRNRTVRSRIFYQNSPSTCARRWIGHQKLNSAATMREIMAGMWDFPCFGPARAHLSRSKRAPIAGGHNAGNTGVGGAPVAGRISGHSAVPTSSLTGSRFQSPCWFLNLTLERSVAAWEPVPG
jgi:hypothetical protein